MATIIITAKITITVTMAVKTFGDHNEYNSFNSLKFIIVMMA